MLSDQIAATIADRSPRRHDEAVCHFSRRVVTSAEPSSPARAKALLFAAGKLADFACSVGLGLDEKVLFGFQRGLSLTAR